MPARLSPALATLRSAVPQSDDWIHEVKFDGYRLLARITENKVELVTRNGNDWSSKLRNLHRILKHLPCDEPVLDGEIVANVIDGKASFHRLQQAFSEWATNELAYQVFDICYLNGSDLSKVPLIQRKSILKDLLQGVTQQLKRRYGCTAGRYACIIAKDGILRAETLRFLDEVREPSDVGLTDLSDGAAKNQKKYASAIKKLTRKKLKKDKMHDRFNERLMFLIESKLEADHDVLHVAAAQRDAEEDNVVDLMEVLKQRLKKQSETYSSLLVLPLTKPEREERNDE